MRVTATDAKNRFGGLSAQAKNEKSTRTARKKAFEARFGDWIATQNARFETLGIPGADLRAW